MISFPIPAHLCPFHSGVAMTEDVKLVFFIVSLGVLEIGILMLFIGISSSCSLQGVCQLLFLIILAFLCNSISLCLDLFSGLNNEWPSSHLILFSLSVSSFSIFIATDEPRTIFLFKFTFFPSASFR